MIDFDFVPPTSASAVRASTPSTAVLVDGPAPTPIAVDGTPVVRDTVVATRLSESATHLSTPEASWGWEELRDYVIHEIETRQGPQPRDFRKEAGIFKSFLARYGVEIEPGKYDATRPVAIAKVAFGPVFNGIWRSAPITVTRFCKGSDPYFGDVILKRL